MKKNIIGILIILLCISVGYSQGKKPEPAKPAGDVKKTEPQEEDGSIYREIVVEDFENIEFKEKDIIFQKSGFEEYKVNIRDEFPAEINDSKKYLGVKLKGAKGNGIQIKFPEDKKIIIDKYCQSISIWVYGKKFSGELSLFIMDTKGNSHRLLFGKLDFHGWRKMTKILPPEIIQTDTYLEQKKEMRLLSILYVPGTWYQSGTNILDPIWQSFYVDDITAKIREKYKDRQSDDW